MKRLALLINEKSGSKNPKNGTNGSARLQAAIFILAVFGLFLFISQAAGNVCQIDLSDTPLDSRINPAPALIMFVLDDSGSMDWEIMTDEEDGKFAVGKITNEYLFDNAGDNYFDTNNSANILAGNDRRYWKSQWFGYNKIFYNPEMTYSPWLDHNGQPLANADVRNAKSHPFREFTTDLTQPYVTIYPEEDEFFGRVLNANQAQDCGYWLYEIGSYDFENGTYGTVQIERNRDSGGTYTIADSIYFEWRPLGSLFSTYYVTDNGFGEPTYVEDGNWLNLNDSSAYGGSARRTKNTGSATFRFNLPYSGTYKLYARWPCGTTNDTNAKITIDPGVKPDDIVVSNAHYYVLDDANGNDLADDGEDVYLVNFEDSNQDGNFDTRKFYKFNDKDADGFVDLNEIAPVAENLVPAALIQRTWSEELQNFANWFTYYRKRWLTTVAAISQAMPKFEGVKVGARTLNGNLIQPLLPIRVGADDQTETFLNKLFVMSFDTPNASTPLRSGLEKVGLYFDTNGDKGDLEDEFRTTPWETGGRGACQQSFALIFTDSHWNGGAPRQSHVDRDNGPPYADNQPGMLADVAMYYYENDLAPDIDNLVPTNFLDKATHQHMVTYAITFGVTGHLNPDDYDLYNIDPKKRVYPEWPTPNFDNKDKLDDVWHAAVNARGKYFSAQNPDQLITAFKEMISDVMARIGSGAPVSINGDELNARTAIYQSGYSTENWTGDVIAYSVNPDTGEVIYEPYKWSANELLDQKPFNDRLIATYDGVSGIPFRIANLPTSMKSMLSPDLATAQKILDYLRGDPGLEMKNGGPFRDRVLKRNGEILRENNKLGDIVHSGPVYENQMVYVGGNDGMLHAFDSETGVEKFAYIPRHVFENISELADPGYDHRYYVDLTPFSKDTGTETLLVGGLGHGGMGYYCLDITNGKDLTSENQVAAAIKWEYPRASTSQSEKDDLGYSFSKAFIVQSKAGWIVIFGNGYNSTNGNAVLFVLNASTGTLLKRIDTGVGPCNGLSTPTPVDTDLDGIVDYVFAGDLMGNLWKFDLTNSSASGWGVAYSSGGQPAPLFQARDENGTPQPITNMCDVMFHCKLHGFIVVFGTGKYLGGSDLLDVGTQTIYGIWDYGDDADDSEFLGTFQRNADAQLSNQPATVTLLEQTEDYFGEQSGKNIRVISDNEALWVTEEDTSDPQQNPDPSSTEANNAGWYFDLPLTKERVVRDVTIRDGKAIVVTVVPESTSPCIAGGGSIVHEIDACNGGRLDKPQFDSNDDSRIDENDMIEIVDPDTGEIIRVAPSGIQYSSMLFEPVILNDPPVEIKYFGSSAGRIESLRELPARVGYSSWRDHW